MVFVCLQKVVEGPPKALEDEAVVPGGEGKSIKHPCTQVLASAGLFPVDALTDVCLDEGALVVASDVAYDFDGNGAVIIIMIMPLKIIPDMMSIISIAGRRSPASGSTASML
mmetsp:Transcript_5498/g.10738  ORF Transcript_5498/g.10738 Transcript_5498/m.10738 type:complete len:112 (-) Transcript_5498:707-1042(-)